MNTSTTIRFASATLLLVIGWLGMLTRFNYTAGMLLCVSVFLLPDDLSDLTDSAMRRWLLGVGIKLIIVLLVVGVVYFHPIVTAETMQKVIRHPAFVLSALLLSLWSVHRRWRRQRGIC